MVLIDTGVDGNRLKLDSEGRSNTWFESNNPLYEDYLFQIPFGRPLNESDDWTIRIKTKQRVLDSIPLHKLNSLINVPSSELRHYEIYTGVGGKELKLDSEGRCNTWFESNNPLYEDYLFQIPFGRPLNESDDWTIRIKTKQEVLDEPIPIHKLNILFAVDKDELSDYKIYAGIGARDLKLDSNGRCNTWFESSNPRYKDYLFQIPFGNPEAIWSEAMGKYITDDFQIIIKKKVQFSYLPDNLDDAKLLSWVTENVNKPLIVRENVVDRLKIFTGTNKSSLPFLKDFSFNAVQHPEFTKQYNLIITFNKPEEGGRSRKRTNRIIRKSRKNKKNRK
jgi:hypothetical protein